MTDAATQARSPWRLLSGEWLLCAVVEFLDDNGDELHCLWLVALDDGREELRARVEQLISLSVDRARNLAMIHSMWPVLLKLSYHVKYTKGQRLTTAQVDAIEEELTRLGISSHPDRRQALLTAVGTNHKTGAPYAPTSQFCTHCRGANHQYRCAGGFHRCTAPGPNEDPHFCRSISAFVIYAAAKQGHLESIVWLHHVVCYDQEIALRKAAYKKHTAVVEWILDHPHRNITVDHRYRDDEALGVTAWHVKTYSQWYTLTKKWGFHNSLSEYIPECLAANHCDLDALQHLFEHPLFHSGFTSTSVSLRAAAKGHLPVLEFLYEHCPNVFKESSALSFAIQDGRLDAAKWLVENNCGRIDDRTVRTAVIYDRLEILQWMLATADDPEALMDTIQREVVHWTKPAVTGWLMREHGMRVTTNHAKEAIMSGYVDLTKSIVHQLQVEWRLTKGRLLLETAIKAEKLELVQWLVQEKQFSSPNAFALASVGKSVPVLGFIYESIRAEAPSANTSKLLTPKSRRDFGPRCLHVVEWLLDHGFRSGLFDFEALDAVLGVERTYAATQRQFGSHTTYSPTTMRRFRALVCRIIEVYDSEYVRQVKWLPKWAMRHGTINSLKRLVAIGHEHVCTRKLLDGFLLEAGDEAVVRWMLEQKPTLFTTLVVRWALTHGKHGLLAWIFESFLPMHSELDSDLAFLLRKCVRTALWTATRCNRDDVLQMLPQWTPVATDPSMWAGIDRRV